MSLRQSLTQWSSKDNKIYFVVCDHSCASSVSNVCRCEYVMGPGFSDSGMPFFFWLTSPPALTNVAGSISQPSAICPCLLKKFGWWQETRFISVPSRRFINAGVEEAWTTSSQFSASLKAVQFARTDKLRVCRSNLWRMFAGSIGHRFICALQG